MPASSRTTPVISNGKIRGVRPSLTIIVPPMVDARTAPIAGPPGGLDKRRTAGEILAAKLIRLSTTGMSMGGPMLLGDIVRLNGRKTPGKTAIVSEDRTVTFGQLRD